MKAYLEALAVSIAAVFAPVEGMMITAGVLIFADLALGVYAAYKRGEPITSAGFRRTVTKCFVYEAAIMLGYLAEHYMSSGIPITKLVGGLISLVEMKSIFENLNIISGQDLFKSIIDSLNSQNNKK